jgi:protein tyrosine/serine phosphatase
MSVLYAHYRLGLPIREAMKELSPRYLHIRAGNTGVLDYVFEQYLERGEPKGLSFTDWVESDDYDPVAMKQTFRAGMLGKLLTDKLLRRE